MANEGTNVETELAETTTPQKKGRKKAVATNDEKPKRGRKKTVKVDLNETLPKVQEEDESVEKAEDDSETVAKEEDGKEGRDGSEEECDGCEEGCDGCEEEGCDGCEEGCEGCEEEEEEQEEGEEGEEEQEEQEEEEQEEDEEESDDDKVYDNEGILIVRNEIPWPLLWALSVLMFVQSIKVFLSFDEVFCSKKCTFIQ